MTGVLRGAVWGAMGTAILELIEPLERRIVGGPPPFLPTKIAGDLLRVDGRAARRRSVVRLGRWMRWSYGVGWGVAYSLARRRAARRSPGGGSAALDALRLSGGIFGLELLALPPIIGTRPLFRPRTLAALALHVAAYAAVVVAADRMSRQA